MNDLIKDRRIDRSLMIVLYKVGDVIYLIGTLDGCWRSLIIETEGIDGELATL